MRKAILAFTILILAFEVHLERCRLFASDADGKPAVNEMNSKKLLEPLLGKKLKIRLVTYEIIRGKLVRVESDRLTLLLKGKERQIRYSDIETFRHEKSGAGRKIAIGILCGAAGLMLALYLCLPYS